ncbi:MAG: GNAT family N-acetyltransferase [Gammaproteobacteria bacterium]|nr:GNAT family N-acetyltransferase [Gammaproteobacteria bacterium]
MKVVAFSNVPSVTWDDAVTRSDDAWLFHRADWIAIEADHFVRANLSFAIVTGERIAAVQPLYLSTQSESTPHGERLVHSGIHRHAGLALSPGLSSQDRSEAEAMAMRHILDVAQGLAADRIQLSVQNLAPRSLRADRDMVPVWVADHGFVLGMGFGPNGIEPAPGFSTLAADQSVELSASEDQLFSGVDRKAIRKAEKSGLSFTTDSTPTGIDRYWTLAQTSALRTGETLSSRRYYETVHGRLGPQGRATIYFARHEGCDVAALFLVLDKSGASYLGGVSDTEFLALRPNDFIHWHAMLDLKARGISQYRLGPIFPEVPGDWPIAKVSRFKSKFGARSYPTIVASRWLDRTAAIAAVHRASSIMTRLAEETPTPTCASSLDADLVAHLLRVVGIDATSIEADHHGSVVVADAAMRGHAAAARQVAAKGTPVVVLDAHAAAAAFDATSTPCQAAAPALYEAVNGNAYWKRLRSLHAAATIDAPGAIPVVHTPAGAPVWSFVRHASGGLVLVGTDLAGDLTRLRQGDPAAARNRPTEPVWGIAGERPLYLFEGQLEADRPHDRMADWWIWTLRDALVRHAGVVAREVLPGGAKGAVIVTGDDDQAYLTDYAGQLERLGQLPITYFLHPLTRHTRETMAQMSAGREIEWELHPDALDTPGEYGARLAEQCAWFERLVGRRPRLVRNHGFLNDGYWGHAKPWIAEGIVASTNLPGLDGRVLNGSLLPGRLALGGTLTPHWSLLTAFGDGVFFVGDASDDAVTEQINRFADDIVASEVPGIVVMNLHPANHVKAAAMHAAARGLVDQKGFAALTFGAALGWFENPANTANSPVEGATVAQRKGFVQRLLHGLTTVPSLKPLQR